MNEYDQFNYQLIPSEYNAAIRQHKSEISHNLSLLLQIQTGLSTNPLARESLGGNAFSWICPELNINDPIRCGATNGKSNSYGEIVALGNFQDLPPLLQKDINLGKYIHIKFRIIVPLLGDPQIGRQVVGVYIDRQRLKRIDPKQMSLSELLLLESAQQYNQSVYKDILVDLYKYPDRWAH